MAPGWTARGLLLVATGAGLVLALFGNTIPHRWVLCTHIAAAGLFVVIDARLDIFVANYVQAVRR